MNRFVDALLRAPLPVIMEVKPQDGHGRDLLHGRSVADVVGAYASAGAPCVSVVTGRWFGGDTGLLREASAATDLPLLQKDFLTRPSQLARSRDLGADAVLLTAALLPPATLGVMIDTALSLGLTPFVEVVDDAEIAAVTHGGDCIVAVNNKDITTRERDPGDLERSGGLLPAVRRLGPAGTVSASAIDGPRTAAALLDAGYDGLLVGTALLEATSVDDWVADLERLRH